MKHNETYKRQTDYATRMKQAGNVLVSVWVPANARDQLTQYAEGLRKQAKEVQHETT